MKRLVVVSAAALVLGAAAGDAPQGHPVAAHQPKPKLGLAEELPSRLGDFLGVKSNIKKHYSTKWAPATTRAPTAESSYELDLEDKADKVLEDRPAEAKPVASVLSWASKVKVGGAAAASTGGAAQVKQGDNFYLAGVGWAADAERSEAQQDATANPYMAAFAEPKKNAGLLAKVASVAEASKSTSGWGEITNSKYLMGLA